MVETVRLHGLEELSKKLKRLPENVRNRHLRRTVKEGAKVVLYGAIHNVNSLPSPKGERLSKGHISKMLGIALHKGRRGIHQHDYRARIGVRFAKEQGEGAAYWRFVEFGTSKMAARPFLRPAFTKNQFQILKIMKRTLLKAVEIEAKR